MRIMLIDLSPEIFSQGLRILSSCLKRAGHEVKMIFLPLNVTYPGWFDSSKPINFDMFYPKTALDSLIEIAQGVNLIGISLMSAHFPAARDLTRELKKYLAIPIIWGGIHPTFSPDECLCFVDMVCVGEGEEAVVELANRLEGNKNIEDIANIRLRDKKDTRQNIRSLIHNLDSLPFPDYDYSNHLILERDRIVPMQLQHLKNHFYRGSLEGRKYWYRTAMARGCPFQCTFCCNAKLKLMYKDKGGYLRNRSVGHLIEELLYISKTMPFVDYISFMDDDFLAKPIGLLEEFRQEYKKSVGLPFRCIVTPNSVSEEKLGLLVDAGLRYVCMGIQTGSERLNREIYNRQVSNKTILKAAKSINKFLPKDGWPPGYDILVDNPWEKMSDSYQTLKLLSQIPKPFFVHPFTLVFYPGTVLYERAIREKMVDIEKDSAYHKSVYHYMQDGSSLDFFRFALFSQFSYQRKSNKLFLLLQFLELKFASNWIVFHLLNRRCFHKFYRKTLPFYVRRLAYIQYIIYIMKKILRPLFTRDVLNQ